MPKRIELKECTQRKFEAAYKAFNKDNADEIFDVEHSKIVVSRKLARIPSQLWWNQSWFLQYGIKCSDRPLTLTEKTEQEAKEQDELATQAETTDE